MFWSGRFGFHQTSSLDSLLDRPDQDVSLEAILDEDELLQECKAQNTKLIDYFQRIDVLNKLFAYVTGQLEGEGAGRFKYPHVATEVLCSDIWSIVETCLSSPEELLVTFWENILDRSPDDMKAKVGMATSFAKINAVFLAKKPVEVFAFIQAQPKVLERILGHLEVPAFVDLLVRIMQLDEHTECTGVVEWLSSQGLMRRLIEMLSPKYSDGMHVVVSEVIKGIISMVAPSPGAGLSDNQNGPTSNRFARELARRENISQIIGYIIQDFGPDSKFDVNKVDLSVNDLPDFDSSTSSVVNSVSVIVELIRKNNSDYFEPYLFHTLRNRLIQVQQTLKPGDGRESLELAMRELVERMGVVHLGPLLHLICDCMSSLQSFLLKPRSLQGSIHTTVGAITPLTFERYRICELYAELIHCSNMSLLNRASEFDHLYDSDGRLQGGLQAMEELARVIALGAGKQPHEDDADDNDQDNIEPALELPVSSASHDSPSLLGSDDDMGSGETESIDNDAMEDITLHDEPISSPIPIKQPLAADPPNISPNSNSISTPSSSSTLPSNSFGSESEGTRRRTGSRSRRNSQRLGTLEPAKEQQQCVGDRLKQCFLDMRVLRTLLDLFFKFTYNNFLHSVVYDLIHQILTGRVDGGLNRELIIALFRDVEITSRIIQAQKCNDEQSSKTKGNRVGYMGHLTLIADDIVNALAHYPADLVSSLESFIPRAEWDEYVSGPLARTKANDNQLLGGGKPVLGAARSLGTARWRVDEEDSAGTVPAELSTEVDAIGDLKGDFRRVGSTSARLRRESGSVSNGADFGPPLEEETDEVHASSGPPQFARYLAHELQVSNGGAWSSDDDEDEDDDGGWLAQSTFVNNNRSDNTLVRHERSALTDNGFDNSFDFHKSPKEDDDDEFGAFNDAGSVTGGSNPFHFHSDQPSASEFDGFGDNFGDFHGANDSMTASSSTNSWGELSTESDGAWLDTALEKSLVLESERTIDSGS